MERGLDDSHLSSKINMLSPIGSFSILEIYDGSSETDSIPISTNEPHCVEQGRTGLGYLKDRRYETAAAIAL